MMGVDRSDDHCKVIVTLPKSVHELLTEHAGRKGAKVSMLARRMIEHCLQDLESDDVPLARE